MKKHIHIAIPGGHVTWTGEEPPTPEFMEAINKMVEKAKEKVRNDPDRFDISEENKERLAEIFKSEIKPTYVQYYFSDNGREWTQMPNNPKYAMEILMNANMCPVSDYAEIKPLRYDYRFIPYTIEGVKLIMKFGVPDRFYMKIPKPKKTTNDPSIPKYSPPAWRGKTKFKK